MSIEARIQSWTWIITFRMDWHLLSDVVGSESDETERSAAATTRLHASVRNLPTNPKAVACQGIIAGVLFFDRYIAADRDNEQAAIR